MTCRESSRVGHWWPFIKRVNCDNTLFCDKIAYVGVLPFAEDPDLSCTAGSAVPQHLPPCDPVAMSMCQIYSLLATSCLLPDLAMAKVSCGQKNKPVSQQVGIVLVCSKFMIFV